MKTVLVTGGSQGIGYELAKCFAQDGFRVILAARDPVRLQEACANLQNQYQIPAEWISIDLSLSDGAEKLYESVKDRKIDALVNNAGTGYTGKLWDIQGSAEDAVLGVNIRALTVLTRLFLKDMTERGEGQILNTASTGGFQPGPYTALYYASKSFFVSYSRAANQEARPYGVSVSCLCPGPVDTGFYDKAGGKKPFYAMDPETCARYAYKHLGEEVIIPGLLNRLVYHLPVSLKTGFVEKRKRKELQK